MTSGDTVVVYDDDFGSLPGGNLFYPVDLRRIQPILAELNREEIRHPESFDANIELYLDLIVGRFRSIHDTHRQALAIHGGYRTDGRQYCLYLRSFSWAGLPLSTFFEQARLVQNVGFAAADMWFQEFLKDALPPGTPTLSFVNTFAPYPSGVEQDGGYLERVTIPSIRVLSHNWKAVVREAIRGARVVILNAQGQSEGVAYETELLAECGMEHRTIVTGPDLGGKGGTGSIGRFHAVVELADGIDVRASDQGRRLADAIRSLATDGFRQTNPVDDLSGLPCWVVDRNIDAAIRKLGGQRLAGIPYDHFIPSSLRNNWTYLTEHFPKLVERWRAIEALMAQGRRPRTEELAAAMYAAMAVFHLAVTLERYYEMAMSLSIMGMAHRLVTGRFEIMAACYAHAAQCARWSRDAELSAFLTDAASRLKEELAARRPEDA